MPEISIVLSQSLFNRELCSNNSHFMLRTNLNVGSATSILIANFLFDLQEANLQSRNHVSMQTSNWERAMGSIMLVLPET